MLRFDGLRVAMAAEDSLDARLRCYVNRNGVAGVYFVGMNRRNRIAARDGLPRFILRTFERLVIHRARIVRVRLCDLLSVGRVLFVQDYGLRCIAALRSARSCRFSY